MPKTKFDYFQELALSQPYKAAEKIVPKGLKFSRKDIKELAYRMSSTWNQIDPYEFGIALLNCTEPFKSDEDWYKFYEESLDSETAKAKDKKYHDTVEPFEVPWIAAQLQLLLMADKALRKTKAVHKAWRELLGQHLVHYYSKWQ